MAATSPFEGHNNSTHYSLEIKDLAAAVSVIKFEGSEAISESYEYELSLAIKDVVDPATLINQKAILEIDWDGEPRKIHGLISEATHLGPLVGDDSEEYSIVFTSPLYSLDINRQCRVFLNRDAKAIIEQVLKDGGINSSEYKFELTGNYPIREMVIQYNETDFNFISRLMEREGIYYHYAHETENVVLVIRDDSNGAPKLAGNDSLTYKPGTGNVQGEESISKLQRSSRYLTAGVKLKDYNYRTPESPLLAEASSQSGTASHGLDYRYGENYKNQEDGDQVVRRRQEAMDWQRDLVLAETDCRGLIPGYVLSVVNPEGDVEGDFLILSVTHQGDQSSAFAFGGGRSGKITPKTYSNQVLMIKTDMRYRPPVDESRIPKVHGVFSAKIETTGGDYAYVDEQGRYKLRLPFDLGDTQQGGASHPVRMCQPYAGQQHGFHFPLHAGTEVLITGVNGDVDRPVIIGAVPNPDTTSPVTSGNNSQNIIRTWGGNELLMDDMQNQEKIDLFTKDKKNILSLDANSEGHKVQLRTEEGEAEIFAAKTMNFESGDSYTLQTGNDQIVTVENRYQLLTKNKDITYQSAANIDMTAQKNIRMSADEENIELSADKDMVIETGQSMSVRVIDEDMEIIVESGNISIEAAKDITIAGQGGGPITIGQGGGTIEISTGGDLTIDANSIEINGSSINIKGTQVGNN